MALQLMALKNCFTPNEVREALRTLPKTLTETYDKILDSIPKRSYIRAALQWVACSVRPLSPEELAMVAVIDPAVAKPNGSGNQLFDGGETIQKMLSKLIHVQETYPLWEYPTQESKPESLRHSAMEFKRKIEYYQPSHIVVFSHSSVRDYLLQRHDDANPSRSISFSEETAHRFIAKSCLTIYRTIYKAASVGNKIYVPFFNYLAEYWHTHAAHLPDEEPGSLAYLVNEEPRAMGFLMMAHDGYMAFSFAGVVGYENFQTDHPGFQTEPPSSGQILQYAACSGFNCVLDTILASNPDLDVNAFTEYGPTALSLACQRKHWQIADSLLERGADPNKHNEIGVPLFYASKHGSDDIAQKLISHGADVNAWCEPDRGYTPLEAAIEAGHLSTIKLLLINGADPHMNCRGSISSAAYGRHECMDLLLKHGTSLKTLCNDAPSPLEYAAASGSVETVKLLLAQGVDVNDRNCLMPLQDDPMLPTITYEIKYPRITISISPTHGVVLFSYGSPMHAAAAYGHTEVIKLLLENKAAVNERSHYWETPSTLAKLRGHEATLEYLLSKGGVASEQTQVCYRQDRFKGSGTSNKDLRFCGLGKRWRR